MCDVLSQKNIVEDNEQNPNRQSTFRKLLITRCQTEFDRDYMEGLDKAKYEADKAAADTEEKRKQIQDEFEDKERQARRRSKGNIRFIGELYKLHMLTTNIMHQIINRLICKIDEESQESLCELLSTIGKDLEAATVKIVDDRNKMAQQRPKQPNASQQQAVSFFLDFTSFFILQMMKHSRPNSLTIIFLVSEKATHQVTDLITLWVRVLNKNALIFSVQRLRQAL